MGQRLGAEAGIWSHQQRGRCRSCESGQKYLEQVESEEEIGWKPGECQRVKSSRGGTQPRPEQSLASRSQLSMERRGGSTGLNGSEQSRGPGTLSMDFTIRPSENVILKTAKKNGNSGKTNEWLF